MILNLNDIRILNTLTSQGENWSSFFPHCGCELKIVSSPTEVGISPHCNTTSLVMRPYVLTYTPSSS